MIICDYEFDMEDPNKPGYSLAEVDYYAWVPASKQEEGYRNHRLSLRKNLITGQYEVYRAFAVTIVEAASGLVMVSNPETAEEQVSYSTQNLDEAIRFACKEWYFFHGQEGPRDEVCDHTGRRAVLCRRKE